MNPMIDSLPDTQTIQEEANRLKYRNSFLKNLLQTVFILVCILALTVLIATFLFPVLRIYGSSMQPTLNDGQTVVCLKTSNYQRNQLVAFYYNNKILVKRVIALEGEWVDITDSGEILVNGELLEESYLDDNDKTLKGDIALPYQVPDGKIFVLGDNREVSVDSRSTLIGSISEDQIIGRLLFRIWPLSEFGSLD